MVVEHRLSDLSPSSDDPRFKSTVHLGTVPFTDMPLYIHYFALFFFGFRILNAIDGAAAPDGGTILHQQAFVLLQVMMMLSVVFTVLVHELGHALCSRKLGSKVSGIVLLPFGGVTYHEPADEAWKSVCIAVWGPLTHVVMVILPIILVMYPWRFESIVASRFLYLFMEFQVRLQTELFVLNLLVPASPLDGAKVWTGVLLGYFDIIPTSYILIGWLAASAILIGVYAYFVSAVIAFVAILWIVKQMFQLFNKTEDQLKQVPPFAGLVGGTYLPV